MIIGFGISPSRVKASAGVSYDADAEAFFTAASITDTTQKNAVNQLVLDLKSYNIWTKMKALYPIVGGTASTHKWNLKDPRDLDAAFRLTFTTGWTHASTGITPASAYANTFFNPVTQLTNYSAHISLYIRTNSSTGIDFGTTKNLFAQEFWMSSRFSTSGVNLAMYDLDGPSGSLKVASSDSRGFTVGTVQNNTSLKLFKNGSQIGVSNTTNTSTPISYNCVIGAISVDNGTYLNYSNKQISFLSVGDGLTDTEAANFYTAVQAYQTTLSRQV